MQYFFDVVKKIKLPVSARSILSKIPKSAVICGLDEVGRGPWAGPLVTCALILPPKNQIKGIRDSKKLSPQKREKIYKLLAGKADFGIGIAGVGEIDRLGLIKATNLAFNRALADMVSKEGSRTPDLLLVDGRDKLSLPFPHKTIIRGDDKIKAIGAASIVAKVTRDRMMVQLALRYPGYGFEDHKGYGTAKHQKALKKRGICPLHRRSFQPIKAFLSRKKSAKISRDL